jgi:hypothetical protein
MNESGKKIKMAVATTSAALLATVSAGVVTAGALPAAVSSLAAHSTGVDLHVVADAGANAAQPDLLKLM